MPSPLLSDLLTEYDTALNYTADLYSDLSEDEVQWRPNESSSAIGWHLGHQAAVAHMMIRNLTAAEPSPDPELEQLMDSATPETQRGALPAASKIIDFRDTVADRVRFRISAIDSGDVGAPAQLRVIAHTLLVAVINHEYQHSKWIGEVRSEQHNRPLPAVPTSAFLQDIDGYMVIGA